jgi:hypothetical protein
MAWRKWVVRGLVFTVAATLGAGGVAYQHWTDPAEVRRQVLSQLAARFSGANVTVESARLRLLGGIAVSELRMTRRDDPDMTNFLHVPSAIIYHDKEQLLGGKLAIRKMELERPRLRVLRDADGNWNLKDLLAEPDLRERIPTIIIKQGTIVVEDRQAHGAEPLEIKDVTLTVVNDPDLNVTFEGSGVSEALGPVRLGGSWQRDTYRTSLTCDAPAVPVGPALVRRLSGACPDFAEHLRDLSGNGALHTTLDYRPGAPRPWEHDVTVSLAQGKFSHQQLPVPLEGITASLRCVNGHIDRAEARARAGAASVHVTADDLTLPLGSSDSGRSCTSWEDVFKKLGVTVENLPVTESLIHRLPEKYHSLYRDFLPSGPMNVDLVLWHDGARGVRSRLTLKPQRMSASFYKFPYPVERITGDIVHKSGGGEPDQLNIDLAGYASGQPVAVKAVLTGSKPDLTAAIDVSGKNIPLDEKLLKALQDPKHKVLAASFHPTGLGNFQVHSHWQRDSARGEGGHFVNHIVITFHDATVNYDVFPIRLEKVSGVLDIQPDHWEFRKFEGSHGEGKFFTGGGSRPDPDNKGKEHVEVAIAGRSVQLDDDLRRALVSSKREEWQRTWATFNPEGRIDFDGTVRLTTAEGKESAPDIELTVWPRGCRVTPKFFAYTLDELRGKVHYEKGTVELENMTAAHKDTRVTLDRAIVQIRPGGGFLADLLYLHGNPLVTDADFVAALPEGLRKAVAALAVQGPLELQTRLYIDAPPGSDPPRIYWDGSAALRGTTIHTGVALEHVTGTVAMRGWHDGRHIDGATGNLDVSELTVFNQPIRNLRGQILVTVEEPDVLQFPGLLAEYFGGQVYGPLRIELGSKPHYRLNLTAAQVKLEDFGRHNFNNTELNGLAVARIYLEGEGGELSGLKGNGRIDVPQGRMYKLPLLLDLLKFLGLRLPDRTFFEEAHVVFDIEGLRAHVKQLELYGNAISLRGSGDANIDGSDLDFAFNVDWARLGQVLPEGVREVPREISNQLFRIDMRGKVGDVRFREVPVPLLMGPLKRMFAGDDDRWGTGEGAPKR